LSDQYAAGQLSRVCALRFAQMPREAQACMVNVLGGPLVPLLTLAQCGELVETAARGRLAAAAARMRKSIFKQLLAEQAHETQP
jgi:hypothetical protein